MKSSKSLRLVYIANSRIPTEKAHGIQIMEMCEAFAREGAEVELVVPRRLNPIKENPFEYYGVEKNFKINKLPCLDLVRFGKIGFFIQSLSFAKMAMFYTLFKKADIIYSRDELPLFCLSFLKKNLYWEAHAKIYNIFVRRVLKRAMGIVCITQKLKDFYIGKEAGSNRILVSSDAVDIKKFEVQNSKFETRKKFGFPESKILVGYVGMLRTLDMEKGVDIAIKALNFLDKKTALVLVGGYKKDIDYYKGVVKNLNLEDRVIFVGQTGRDLVPQYLSAFDVLLAPYPQNEHYKYFMSPLKIFEYMAAKRPIVVSDLPSVREVLSEESAVLVEPDNPRALAEGVKKALEPEVAEKISERAYQSAKNYTWQKRAEEILDFINKHE